ncbi:MAG: hypothetical protein KAS62_03635 [Candidatus Delongbacteria bacterium]|nr:hypothetical protein [Candidatus Delongbacteria bacterium]
MQTVYEAYNVPIIKEGRGRDGKARTYKVKEQIYVDEELHNSTDGYWVIKGIELYKKDVLNFKMFSNGKARIRINGELKLFSVGDSLEVGNLILKERDKITKKFTGNVLINRPYKGVIILIAPRYVYVKSYNFPKAIKLKNNRDAVLVEYN